MGRPKASESWVDMHGTFHDAERTLWAEIIRRALVDWNDLVQQQRAVIELINNFTGNDSSRLSTYKQREQAIKHELRPLADWFENEDPRHHGSLAWIIDVCGWSAGLQYTLCSVRGQPVGYGKRVERRGRENLYVKRYQSRIRPKMLLS